MDSLRTHQFAKEEPLPSDKREKELLNILKAETWTGHGGACL
jgi:hypothetical protein